MIDRTAHGDGALKGALALRGIDSVIMQEGPLGLNDDPRSFRGWIDQRQYIRVPGLLLVAALLVIACGPDPAPPTGPVATLAPVVTSARPSGPEPSDSVPIASADISVVEPRGEGLTLTSDVSGQADLEGGRYRIAWYAPECHLLNIWWQAGSAKTVIPVELPSGESFVDMPGGPGSLDRTASCGGGADYTIRFERVP